MQMMQEWLALHKLDRKQLAALAGNAQAAQVYEAYLHQTVQEVMEDLLADFDEPEPESEPAQGTHQVNLTAAVACATCRTYNIAPQVSLAVLLKCSGSAR